MKAARLAALVGLALAGLASLGARPAEVTGLVTASQTPDRIVAMRRLTEAQYRNSIADIFGPDIKVAGRFEPIVRPAHELIASGASSSTISPSGLEQFDAMARNIAAQVFDDAHRSAFMPCEPQDAAKPDDSCAKAALAPIGRYLFRRPQTEQELSSYVAIASIATRQAGSFNKGLELALAAMLVAPDFLYVIESAEAGSAALDAYARASRLSLLLWNTTPGEPLLRAAARGELDDQAKLEATAQKMIASPRFENGVRAFFADMLLFEKFDEIAKDPLVFPRFNPEVARALPEQMLRTISDMLIVQSGDYRDLFTTRRTFMTRSLGPVYRIPVRAARGWEAFEFPADDDRAGLLGQAGFLALYSHSGRSSATLRGRAVRELLMCQPVPNPPGNVNFAAVQDINSKTMPTARDRLTVHRSDPSCAGCHQITDPIGLTLERFDGIGSGRTTENGAAINVVDEFEGTQISGAAGLGKAMAANPATSECLAGRAFQYATGRLAEDAASNTPALSRDFSTRGYKIASLFFRVATMPEAYRVASPSAKGAQP
jgi:Protein of unknown function (DUF1588)/Protein of unknown function (DUF1592)/Protein of unknown function (DUF1595)/Protein of unknown function (DUF1587)